jgi:isopentenyl diphosphate isomerase/L-lactate dehydrogenase-like FMN-dependent dehydrogenase/surfactin synthase thioesterase subunit
VTISLTATTTATATAADSTPIRVPRPKQHPTSRLACFPHAGGAADAFTALAAALPDDVELLAFQYPGRRDRRSEPCATDLSALADEAARVLAPYADVPLSLLGHSMGALVAFETARRLEAHATLAHVFVSAARPPDEDWEERDLDALTDDQIIAELRRLGGVPEALLQEEDIVAEILRLLRADHRALRRYHCAADAVLKAPITVLLADADPKNALNQMHGWARHTADSFDIEVLSGGHFALTDRDPRVAQLVTRLLHADSTHTVTTPPISGTTLAEPAPTRHATSADLVREIYLAGTTGVTPHLTTDLTALEEHARTVMTPSARGYVIGDAGTGATGRANRTAFERHRLIPRVLRGVVKRDLTVSVLGQRLPAPILLAPIAAQTVVHPDGELATAQGAADADVPFVLSTGSSYALEDVDAAAAVSSAPRWFQLYWPTDKDVAASLVNRAEQSGYSALVLTVDAPTFGYRPTDLDHGYLPFLQGAGIANFTSDPAFRAGLPDPATDPAVIAHWARVFANPALAWDDLPWLRTVTSLPILLKGVLHPHDACRALDIGAVDGVIVSNHGGRQLDGSIASLDALPAVRAAVGDDVPVLLDSGIRTGSDVIKALALGADAVLYGRPYIYGLALDGRRGVAHVLRCLLAEIDLALALTGCPSIADITPDLLASTGWSADQRTS